MYVLKFIKIVFSFFLLFLFSTSNVFAAELSLNPGYGNYKVGDNINVRVVLSSPNQSANAISTTLSFSKDLLTLISISKSNSLISLWAQEPSYSNATGTINMEGVILNGYTGSNGTILNLSFKAKEIGDASINFLDSSVLANDGAGTSILNKKNKALFEISGVKEKIIPIVNNTTKTDVDKIPILEIEELKKKNELIPNSRFFITSIGKKDKTPYNIEIDEKLYSWYDSGDHIFETPPLYKGAHLINVFFESMNGTIISKSLSFNTIGVSAPIFTDYSENIKEDEFIIVKGVVDPLNYVIINLSSISSDQISFNEIQTIQSNEKGLFSYVSENRVVSGVYTLTAQAKNSDDIKSIITPAIKVTVHPYNKSILSKLTTMFSLIIPLLALIIILILIIIYGWHRIRSYHLRMRDRLIETQGLVSKSFSILEEDLEEEGKIFKKTKSIKPLTKEESTFVDQFKKDISSAEKVIINDIKNSNKEV